MKNFGKGVALFLLCIFITALITTIISMFYRGDESTIQGISLFFGILLCYPISIKFNSMKALKGLCIFMIALILFGAFVNTENASVVYCITSICGFFITYILAMINENKKNRQDK